MTEAPHMTISDDAAAKIAAIRENKGNQELMLRITVLGGGCSGFQYDLDMDDTVNPDDFTFENNGAKIVVDATSIQLLNGSEVGYVQDMVKSSFAINNPNATAACGCGESFGI